MSQKITEKSGQVPDNEHNYATFGPHLMLGMKCYQCKIDFQGLESKSIYYKRIVLPDSGCFAYMLFCSNKCINDSHSNLVMIIK